MPSLKERAKTLIELIAGAYFIFADRPLEIEPKAALLLTSENRDLIGSFASRWRPSRPGPRKTTEAAMRAFAEQNNLKLGAVAQPLRVALTGPYNVAWNLRRPGGAGTAGMPGPARRSGPRIGGGSA